VPRVEDWLLHSVVYLYAERESAEDGDPIGGSGLIVGQPTRLKGHDQTVLYFVTCRHTAFEGAPVVRLMTLEGKVEIYEPKWYPHPGGADIAVAHFADVPGDRPSNYPYSWIDREFFASSVDFEPPDNNLRRWDFGETFIGPGDETVTLGRFVAADGKERNVPTARFGNLSTGDVVPIEAEKADGSTHAQECFLVEARSLNGYSGSPVILFHAFHGWAALGGTFWARPIGSRGPDSVAPIHTMRLLGVDCGHLMAGIGGKVVAAISTPKHPYPGSVSVNAGMMMVVPAWKIGETLDDSDVVKEETKPRNG
jgi:hypothetical protein